MPESKKKLPRPDSMENRLPRIRDRGEHLLKKTVTTVLAKKIKTSIGSAIQLASISCQKMTRTFLLHCFNISFKTARVLVL
jgi:hypothetical protein